MISAAIPITMNSTADLSLKIDDFIEYSLKNDLNIVTTKWLAHTRKITITEARGTLQDYWDKIGLEKGYCATFSVLSSSTTEGLSLELIDHDKLSNNDTSLVIISTEIYAVHAVPLKDKSVQLGMINVPIYDLAGEIIAPWIDTDNFPKLPSSDEIKLTKSADNLTVEESDLDEPMLQQNTIEPTKVNSDTSVQQPPNKKMKMIKKTRTFMENGYQMTEIVNELVPCEDDDEMVDVEIGKPAAADVTAATTPAPTTSTSTKPKQSSMMNFFKKK